MERKVNMQTSKKMTRSISWQEKDIFSPSDFTSLVEQNKVIVVTPTGFSNVQKLQWFKDPHFQKIHQSLHEMNEQTTISLHTASKGRKEK